MVAIILVNYQSYDDTLQCMQSILATENSDYHLFLVDNSKNKENQKRFLDELACLQPYDRWQADAFHLQDNIKKISVIDAENNGFAAANNIILKQLSSCDEYEYIWLLNNDTVIYPNTINEYIAAFEKMSRKKKLGMLGCVLVYEDNPSVIQGTGGVYYKFLGTTKHVLDGKAVAEYDPDERHEIDYPIGASMFISKEFLADIGLLNESYFLYFEELDWVVRGKAKGWVCDYAADIFIRHKAGKTIGGKNNLKRKSSTLSDYYFYRNRLRFSLKYTLFHFPFVVATVLLSVAYRVATGRSAFLRLFVSKNKV